MRDLLKTLRLGFANTLGQNAEPGDYVVTERQFWTLSVVMVAVYGLLSVLYNIAAPLNLSVDYSSLGICVLTIISLPAAAFLPALLWPRSASESPYLLPAIFISVHIPVALIEGLLWTWLYVLWPEATNHVPLWKPTVIFLEALIVYRAFLQNYPSLSTSLLLRFAATILLFLLATYEIPRKTYQDVYYVNQVYEDDEPSGLNAEKVFSKQPELMENALSKILPSERGKTDIYTITFGGDGYQEVFKREALLAQKSLETWFGSPDHSIALINHSSSVNTIPLASYSNLRTTLADMKGKAQKDEDILVLYLTSHGSQNATLTVDMPGFSMLPVNAQNLAALIKGSGFRWKVIIVSACYAGSFIPYLKSDNTLIITSASADRTSFGCSDTAELTYFGQAFLKDALPDATSLQEAYSKTASLISDREKAENIPASRPQISMGKNIKTYLARLKHKAAE
jgi:hypothetical protein